MPVSPQTLGEPNVSVPIAAILSQAMRLNVLLAVFNMIPIPPLDGGNVLAACCRTVWRSTFNRIRPYGFLLLYALILTGGFEYIVLPPYSLHHARGCPSDQSTVRRHASCQACGRPAACTSAISSARSATGCRCRTQYDCFYFVADWHALTSDFADTSQLTAYAYENVADWIGAGLDPEKSTFFVQSLVPEHAELYLLLSMVVPVPWLERVPTYKEQQETLKDKDLSSIGFLGYPLLQTADVAMYDAQLRAGRRGSGRAPRAGARGRAPLQQLLRCGTTCWSSRSRC